MEKGPVFDMKQRVSHPPRPIHESDLSPGRNIFSPVYYLRRGVRSRVTRREFFSPDPQRIGRLRERNFLRDVRGVSAGCENWKEEVGNIAAKSYIFVFARYHQRSYKAAAHRLRHLGRGYASLVTKDSESLIPCQANFCTLHPAPFRKLK